MLHIYLLAPPFAALTITRVSLLDSSRLPALGDINKKGLDQQPGWWVEDHIRNL
ncbi:hypothetical protein Peur_039966 [Populus x canadensis]